MFDFRSIKPPVAPRVIRDTGRSCRKRTAARARSGYTLIELLMAMGSATVLVGGLASSVLISSRAFSPDASAGADANRSAVALAQLSADLRLALRFTERTATAATFTVPDRTGDQLPETIRYSWSGTSGQPLMYQYNGETALALVNDVKQFNLTAVTRTIAAEPVLPPPSPVVYEAFAEAKAAADVQALAVPVPGGTAQGKLLIAAVAVDGAVGPTLNGPAGWNLLSAVNGGGQVGMAVWWKFAGAAEPANYSFTWTGPEKAYGWIMRFGGANALGPINAFASATGTGSTPQCPSVTTTEGYTMILRLGGFDDDDVNVNNAGMANHTTITVDESDASDSSASGGAAYRSLATPISSGTATFALTASEEYVTYTIAIAPQPAG
jgi:type II secretory pathway pseudopilin PulG